MHINVRKEFAACVAKLNGVVLDELLKRPQFANADFWFPDDRVVVELKCLEEDLDNKPTFQQKKTALHTSWVKRGLMPRPRMANERIMLNTTQIPEQCALEVLEVMRRHLQPSVKKADAQIKGIKERLNAPDAKGLLLLVNDGNHTMKPSLVAHLLARLLNNGNYSHINSVIYCSVNVRARVPGVPVPVRVWFGGFMPDRERVSSEFTQRLRDGWHAHEEEVTGTRIDQIPMPSDYSIVDGVSFDRPHV